MVKGRYLTAILAVIAAIAACGSNPGKTAAKDIRLDYAYYNPLSLVVRDQLPAGKPGLQRHLGALGG